MTRHALPVLSLTLTGWLAASGSLQAGPTNLVPDFKEVYELLRANLPGATEDALNRAAVAGLLAQLHGRVSLAAAADGSVIPPREAALGKSGVLENNVVYLRVNRVTASLADELVAAGQALVGTNQIAGVVLDLRFAYGSDDAAAAAKLLAAKRISAGPLAVLVNGETRGAAETLAAALHQAGAGLLLGSPTAGEAMAFREFPLRNGERFRVVAAPETSGGAPIPCVKPDVAVAVTAGEERAFFDNPYQTLVAGGTNASPADTNFLPFVDHTSEADLVRQRQKDGKLIGGSGPRVRNMNPRPGSVRRSGVEDDGEGDSAPAGDAGTQTPVLRDPVLARAVDLVKGLAIVHPVRP